MKPQHSIQSYFLVLLIGCTVTGLGFLASCATSSSATTITGSWRDPAAGQYKDFFVAVITQNKEARSTIENDLFFRLKKEDVKVERSMELFPNTDKVKTPEERAAAVEKIQSLGHDAILTISLKKKTEDSRFVPGKTEYNPTNIGYGTGYNNQMYQSAAGPGYYGTFGGYYNYNYSVSSTDGYYEMAKDYFMESNLYDAHTSKLVWSAQSEVFNPMNLTVASADFSKVMVDALKAAKLIHVN